MTRTGLHRILVVDDEPDILAVTRMTLRARGDYEVEVCESGRDALAAAPRFEPDLILIDVMMPEMDGPTTLKALRQDSRLDTTPVVFMTAKTMRDEVKRFLDLGAVGVIAKPFDPRTLVDQIERIAGGTTQLTHSEDSEMTSLLAAYAARLPETIQQIRDLWSDVERGSDGAVERLHRGVHRIAGTAGTYGHDALSEVGGRFEQYLYDHLPVGSQPTPTSRKQIDQLIAELANAAGEPRSPIR